VASVHLQFNHGSETEPRGHALVYFHGAAQSEQLLATYCLILPIALDVSRYVPPVFASQISSLGMEQVSAFAFPPIPEKVESPEFLRRLAELRGDDLVYGGSLSLEDLQSTVNRVNECVQEYQRLYTEHQQRRSQEPSSLQVDEVLYEFLGDRGRLEELAKLLGKLRFAVDGQDHKLAEETQTQIRSLTRFFPPEYQMEALLAAARSSEARASLLAQLYLDRCYRLLEQDFRGAQEVEARIHQQQGLG